LQLVGTEKEDTELDKSPWDRQPPRFASTERDLIGEPVWELQQIYKEAIVEVDELKRHHLVWDMVRIHKDDGPFYIGTVANKPQIYIVGKTLMNVPTKEELRLGGFVNPWILPSPALTNTETYSFK
jgi:peptide/nickel transport system substrate-binding protein